MGIYKRENNRLVPIKEESLSLEKDIQNLTENNLELLFGLQLVSTEFSIHNFRIDTLAFDAEANSFVIVEYKKDKSSSVIDQGYTYLSLMLNNKSDFILEYNERTGNSLKREDVDWSQSRVLFLAQNFTTYQQNAINFRDLPIELWEVKLFDNSTILYNQLISSESKESIKTVTKSKTIENVSREVKVYTVEDHLGYGSPQIVELFNKLRERVLVMGDDIEERPKKKYISYRTKQGFLFVHMQRSQLKLHIIVPKIQLDDPKSIARDVTRIGHYGGGMTEIVLDKIENLSYVMTLIEQSYLSSKYSKIIKANVS